MIEYIEVTSNDDNDDKKPVRTLLRKDAIIGVDEEETGCRIVIVAGAKKNVLHTSMEYDKIKDALTSVSVDPGLKLLSMSKYQ